MCASTLPLCLLLWIVVSRTRGEVIVPQNLIAEAGHPLTLSCNVTMAAGETVRQVRWLYKNKRLLTYEQSVPVRISHQEPNVQLTTHHNNASYITIKKVQPDHDGCYSCIFDTFPAGPQEGRFCVSVIAKVHLEGNKTAISGKSVTLSCWYSNPESVEQVLWRKIAEQGDTTLVASYTKRGHTKIKEPFSGRVSLSRTLDDSQLTIQSVRTEDEACYTCEFHTFPDGRRSATACLSVYVLPKPEVTSVTSPSGVTEANCTAQSRPAAEIMWNVGGDNRTLGPPISSEYPQGDGTTIVTSTLFFQSGLLSDLYVKCIVHHRGLEKPLSVSLYTNMGPAMVILLSVCGVAAVLLLCLCVCLCKCFVCTDGFLSWKISIPMMEYIVNALFVLWPLVLAKFGEPLVIATDLEPGVTPALMKVQWRSEPDLAAQHRALQLSVHRKGTELPQSRSNAAGSAFTSWEDPASADTQLVQRKQN